MGKNSTLIGGLGLGIAVGVAFGFYIMAPNVVGGPSGTDSGISRELDAERSAREQTEQQVQAADEVLRGLSVEAVARTLADRSVLVVTTPDADTEMVASLGRLLDAAGATRAGEVQLTADLLTSNSGDEAKSIAANSLPAGAQLSEKNLTPGMHTGQLLGAALSGGTSESDRSVVLSSLTKAGLVKIHAHQGGGENSATDALTTADLAIVVTGAEARGVAAGDKPEGGKAEGGSIGDGLVEGTVAEDGAYGATFLANFTAGLDASLDGAVLTGPAEQAEESGAIAVARENRAIAEEVSTVDNIDTMAGRIAAIRALAQQATNRAGHYGAANSASAASPDSQISAVTGQRIGGQGSSEPDSQS